MVAAEMWRGCSAVRERVLQNCAVIRGTTTMSQLRVLGLSGLGTHLAQKERPKLKIETWPRCQHSLSVRSKGFI